jgi:thiamine biosynthesis protein ThiI
MNCKRAVSLISPGIDSPVATWMMVKKGVDIIGIHCSTGDDSKSKDITIKMCEKIGVGRLYVVSHAPLLQRIAKDCRSALVCVLCKRFMVRIADAIAKKEDACCIITGENLGQVASQTLDNMVIITSASTRSILRPILCNDKQETVDIAKKIGTYEIGLDAPPCCSFVPDQPATKTIISKVEAEEARLDVDSMVEEAVSSAEILEL